MLLAEPKWALLPVRHLFALADLLLHDALCHLGYTTLRRDANFLIVGLQVDKVRPRFEKVHPWQVLAEHLNVVRE